MNSLRHFFIPSYVLEISWSSPTENLIKPSLNPIFSCSSSEISKTSNFLFHGENHGRIEECSSIVINSIKKKFEAINYIYLSTDELKKGVFSKLYSGSENHDLFGNKNIFIVSLQDQKASKK